MRKIVVGIHLGITHTGVAWADSRTPNEINPIRHWPDSGGLESDQVPSSILYCPDGTFEWGNGADGGLQFMKLLLDPLQESPPGPLVPDDTFKWGNSANGGLQFMKLLLDPSEERYPLFAAPSVFLIKHPSQESNSSLADLLGLTEILTALPQDKKPVDVIADYLRAIKTHTLEELARNRGQRFWQVIDLVYHLTIPTTVLSESARALMLGAANKAGIGSSQDLILIPETVAWALYCLNTFPNVLNVGDIFVVMDCGRWTVDLVSYKILAWEPKLELTEVATGGGMCGSVFLNRRFEMMVKKRLGATVFDSWLGRPNGKKHYDHMMEDFDVRLKQRFNGSYQPHLTDVEARGLPCNAAIGVEDGYMDVSLEDLLGIFEPVVKEILQLVQKQIDQVYEAGMVVSSIIMTGGFGSSPYLRKRVEELANTQRDKLSSNFEVIHPKDNWSAAVRGAVITGLKSVEIRSRQACRNYGVDYCTKFEPSRHQKFSLFKFWNKYHECFYFGGCMKWYVKKGDEMVETQKISFPFSKPYDTMQSDMKTEMELWASDSAHAEEHVSHERVYKVCTIEVDLSPLRGSLRRTNSQGNYYYILSFSIIMKIHSARLTFGVENDGGEPCGVTATVINRRGWPCTEFLTNQ